jgi:hypothetical protein
MMEVHHSVSSGPNGSQRPNRLVNIIKMVHDHPADTAAVPASPRAPESFFRREASLALVSPEGSFAGSRRRSCSPPFVEHSPRAVNCVRLGPVGPTGADVTPAEHAPADCTDLVAMCAPPADHVPAALFDLCGHAMMASPVPQAGSKASEATSLVRQGSVAGDRCNVSVGEVLDVAFPAPRSSPAAQVGSPVQSASTIGGPEFVVRKAGPSSLLDRAPMEPMQASLHEPMPCSAPKSFSGQPVCVE